eukprot:g7140.t1
MAPSKNTLGGLNDPLLEQEGVLTTLPRKSSTRASASEFSPAQRAKAEEGRKMVLVIDEFRQQYIWFVRASTSYGILATFLLFVALYLTTVVQQSQIHVLHDANAAWMHPLMPLPPLSPLTEEKVWNYINSLVPNIYHTPVVMGPHGEKMEGVMASSMMSTSAGEQVGGNDAPPLLYEALADRQDVLTGLYLTSKRKYLKTGTCIVAHSLCLSDRDLKEPFVALWDEGETQIPYDASNQGYSVYLTPAEVKGGKLAFLQKYGFLSPTTHEITVKWVATTPALHVLTVVEFAAKVTLAGQWDSSLTPKSVPAKLYPNPFEKDPVKLIVGYKPIYKPAPEEENLAETGHKMGESNKNGTATSAEVVQEGHRMEAAAKTRMPYMTPVDPHEGEWFREIHGQVVNVKALWELGLRLLLEFLCIGLAIVQVSDLMVQVMKPSSDLVVGVITHRIPTDHCGFPYMKSAQCQWFLAFPLSIVCWISTLVYHRVYVTPRVQEFYSRFLSTTGAHHGPAHHEMQWETSSSSEMLYSPTAAVGEMSPNLLSQQHMSLLEMNSGGNSSSFDPMSPEGEFVSKLIHHANAAEQFFATYRVLAGLVIILIISMFFEHIAFQKRLAIIIETFTGIGGDFFHLLLVFLVTLMGFASMTCIMLGAYDEGFSDVFPGAYHLFLSCMGLFKPASTATPMAESFNKFPLFMAVEEYSLNTFAMPVFLLFKLLMIMILFKFVIAFIMEAYKKANPEMRSKSKSVMSDLTWFAWFFREKYFRPRSKGFVNLHHMVVGLKYADVKHQQRCREREEAEELMDRRRSENGPKEKEEEHHMHVTSHPPHLFLDAEEVLWALNSVSQNRAAPGDLIEVGRGCEITPTLCHYAEADAEWLVKNFGQPMSRAVRRPTTAKQALVGQAREIFLAFDEEDTGFLTLRQTAQYLQALGHYHVAHDDKLFRKIVEKYDPEEDGLFSQSSVAEMLKDPIFEYPEYVHQHLHKGSITG